MTPPNGKVALQMMALLDPEEWLPRKAVELSGPGSGPVEVTHQAEVVEGILARVRKAKERRAATAGGVIEATGATGLAETGEGDGDGE
ncbi:hypothetical protein [Planomonospora algeriensis]